VLLRDLTSVPRPLEVSVFDEGFEDWAFVEKLRRLKDRNRLAKPIFLD